MNAISRVARPASCRPLVRRLILRSRLACGGAVAGLFAGSILVAVSGALLDSGPFGIDDIIICPVALALVGATWGMLLKIPNQNASDDDHPSPNPCRL